MTMAKILMSGVGFAALASAAPAAAQYYQYANPYGNAYGYGYGMNSQAAVNRCTAAVQNRLNYRTAYNNGYYGAYNTGRVLNVTRVDPNRSSIRVRGLATSGRVANGLNLFGLLGSNYRADLSFACTVDYNGRIRDIDINRR